jgi:hypothetical protein
MFLIERIAKTDATLLQQSPYIHDGFQEWRGVACRVFEMKNHVLGRDETGRLVFAHVFLVAPLPVDPELPARINVGGKVYDVTSIKPHQDHTGKRLGYRLTVAGA